MDKPEWCSEALWQSVTDKAAKALDWMPEEGPQLRSHRVSSVANAILSAQSQAYTDAARIAEEYYTQDTVIKKQNGEPYNSGNIAISCAQRISAAILQRKEEMK